MDRGLRVLRQKFVAAGNVHPSLRLSLCSMPDNAPPGTWFPTDSCDQHFLPSTICASEVVHKNGMSYQYRLYARENRAEAAADFQQLATIGGKMLHELPESSQPEMPVCPQWDWVLALFNLARRADGQSILRVEPIRQCEIVPQSELNFADVQFNAITRRSINGPICISEALSVDAFTASRLLVDDIYQGRRLVTLSQLADLLGLSLKTLKNQKIARKLGQPVGLDQWAYNHARNTISKEYPNKSHLLPASYKEAMKSLQRLSVQRSRALPVTVPKPPCDPPVDSLEQKPV